MANTLLTPTAVTRKALAILHQKLNFIGSINRQYDDSFAQKGAKIGDSLKIRLPNEYAVRTGKTLDVQDTTEASTTLTVSTQKGVDMDFSSAELTLDLDDFGERVLDPAMSVLAATIENDVMNVYKDVPNQISDVGATFTLAGAIAANKRLTDSLVPMGASRCLNLNTTDNASLVSALSGLFNDPAKVSKNYRDGMVASKFMGFDKIYENTLWPMGFTSGTDDGTGDHKVGAASQTGASITHGSEGTGTFVVGDVISFAGCNEVHPETKVSTGVLKKFVVTTAMTAVATTVAISPSIVTSGAKQNCSASPTAAGAIWKRESDDSTAIGAGADYSISMAHHKDAFAFATADLVMPSGVDFSAREVFDGISLRVIRDYDINNDQFPCRIDVLYGYKTIREQLACRIGFN